MDMEEEEEGDIIKDPEKEKEEEEEQLKALAFNKVFASPFHCNEKGEAGSGDSKGGSGSLLPPPHPPAKASSNLVLDRALHTPSYSLSSHKVPCH